VRTLLRLPLRSLLPLTRLCRMDLLSHRNSSVFGHSILASIAARLAVARQYMLVQTGLAVGRRVARGEPLPSCQSRLARRAEASSEGQRPAATSDSSGLGRRATILVVDDERKIRDLVRSYLELEGYAVLVADTAERALESASRSDPDRVVLDLGLPDLSGEEVARTLRTASNVPIIMLAAKAGEDDRVAGLRLGADDYLAKPFSSRELVARVETVLRRANGSREHRLSFGGGRLSIDRDAREVTIDGSALELTRSEFDLLHALASHAGRVFSRYELINRVQGYD